MSLTLVNSGAYTLASDINQIINLLNGTTTGTIVLNTASGYGTISSLQSGSATGIAFQAWTGTASVVPFSVSGGSGGPVGGALDYIDEYGSFGFTTASSAKIVSGQTGGSATGITLVTWTGSASVTPFSVGGQFNSAIDWIDQYGQLLLGNSSGGTRSASAATMRWFGSSPYVLELFPGEPASHASGIYLVSWDGSAEHTAFGVGSAASGANSYIHDDGAGYFAGSANAPLYAYYSGTATSAQMIGIDSSNISGGKHWAITAYNDGTIAFYNYTDSKYGVKIGNNFLQSGTTFIGFKDSSGNKLAEMKNGSFTIAASGTYYTAGGTYNYSAGGSFDTFDVSEAYETDDDYPTGTVLCPGPDGKLTRCTHDGCRAAMIVSARGGLALGMGDLADGAPVPAHVRPLALVGRIKAHCHGAVPAFAADGQATLLTSDGRGGVRAMRPGEEGYALGYALHDATDDQIGMVVRPLWCRMPTKAATG